MMERADVLWRALKAYRESKTNFSDAVIVEVGSDAGCSKTVTFDRQAGGILASMHFAKQLEQRADSIRLANRGSFCELKIREQRSYCAAVQFSAGTLLARGAPHLKSREEHRR
jgi:hypothetical protein